MKRRLSKLVVFLILGVIVNVAVAWGFVGFARLESVQGSFMKPEAIDWFHRHAPAAPGFPWEVDYTIQWANPVVRKWWITAASSWDDPSRQDSRYAAPTRLYAHAYPTEAGWPFFSLDGSVWWTYPISRDGVYGRSVLRAKASVPIPFGDENPSRQLPCRPIWAGFAINTIFYAAILWLLTLGPFTARRMIRRKRGRCIKCGYDLRGTSGVNCGGGGVCSECGAQSA